jgi:hypothetical protein
MAHRNISAQLKFNDSRVCFIIFFLTISQAFKLKSSLTTIEIETILETLITVIPAI